MGWQVHTARCGSLNARVSGQRPGGKSTGECLTAVTWERHDILQIWKDMARENTRVNSTGRTSVDPWFTEHRRDCAYRAHHDIRWVRELQVR